jgi:hypothetical protein
VSGASEDRAVMDADAAQAPAPRIEMRAGGTPTAEQLAALVVALRPSGSGGDGDEIQPTVPAWTAATLRESVGGPVVLEPSDLREPDPHG